jgi:hypothetical protein
MFRHQELLDMIHDGKLSLFPEMPPRRWDEEAAEKWTSWQLELPNLTPRSILERSLRSFIMRFADIEEEKWSTAIEDELFATFIAAQLQPAIMDNYRRFVVIRGQRENRPDNRNGVSAYQSCI